MSSLSDFQIGYEISPIILQGGIAANMTGGAMPIVSLLQGRNYDLGVLYAIGGDTIIADFFAHFTTLPGGTLIENTIATWPLANQQIAANAQIAQPLKISLRMVAPAKGDVTYTGKQSVMTNVQNQLATHTASGGWFNVATPSFIYQGCLLTNLVDVSNVEEGGQVQIEWQWDFVQPLISSAQAQVAMNLQMGKANSGTAVGGDPPSVQAASNAVGQPSSGLGQNVIPAAAKPAGAAVAPASTHTYSRLLAGG